MTEAIISILIADSTVQTLVGLKTTITDEYKVYPLVVPQEEQPPFITVRMTSNPAIPCKGQRVSAFQPTCTVACYHKNYKDAITLEAAVKDALDGKAAGEYNGVQLSYLRYTDSAENWEQWTDGVGLYSRLPQFEAQVNESTPT